MDLFKDIKIDDLNNKEIAKEIIKKIEEYLKKLKWVKTKDGKFRNLKTDPEIKNSCSILWSLDEVLEHEYHCFNLSIKDCYMTRDAIEFLEKEVK